MDILDQNLEFESCIIGDVTYAILCQIQEEEGTYIGLFPAEDLGVLAEEKSGPLSSALVWAERAIIEGAADLKPVGQEMVERLARMMLDRSALEVASFRELLPSLC